MNRRQFLKYATTSTILLGVSSHSFLANTAVEKPNIVLIMADDLGYEVLGCYGGTSYKTPNLDKLAEDGIRFDHCYSTPKCVPSRVNIMTGRYGFRTGQKWGYIPPEEITFGQVLKSAGYTTALSGKWQLCLLKDNPNHVKDKGFDENCCWAWHEGPRYWNPLLWQNGKIREGIEDRYGPEVFTDFLTDFITRNKNKPFLAYYPMVLPHFAKTGGKYVEPKGPNGRYQTYAEMVSKVDEMVGRVVETLDRLKLREKTLILFTGDNGTPQKVTSKIDNRSIKGGKGSLKDSGTHVPLIANWPGKAKAGTVCDDLIDFSDFMPTLAELAGAELPKEVTIDGRSFAPQLQGKKGNPRDWIYTEWKGKAWIRTKQWKLYSDGRLYDMKNDSLEEQPIYPDDDSDKTSPIRKKLQTNLDNLRKS